MRSLLTLVACVALTSCSSPSTPSTAETPAAKEAPKETPKADLKKYALHGEVQRLDTEAKIATIKHQAIGDWMGAMTMEFPVKDPADFAKLQVGKPVEAQVYVEGFSYWVGDVQGPAAESKK